MGVETQFQLSTKNTLCSMNIHMNNFFTIPNGIHQLIQHCRALPMWQLLVAAE